jgi:hypothetical protein
MKPEFQQFKDKVNNYLKYKLIEKFFIDEYELENDD